MTWPLRCALMIAALLVLANSARAQEQLQSPNVPITDKRMWFAEKDGELALTTTFTEVFDKKQYESLSNGFPVVLHVRIYVYQVGAVLPAALRGARFRLVYDLWDEVYTVERVDERGTENRKFRRRIDALRAVSQLNDYPVASLDDIERGPRYFAGVIVELNPVAPETRAEMMRWLTRRAGRSSVGRGSSFFGSFVSVFVNPQLRDADRVVHLRSQPFFRVPAK